MKTFKTVNTHDVFFDDICFEADSYDSALEKAESVLTSHGYPIWCDENGYISYDFDVEEVADEEI